MINQFNKFSPFFQPISNADFIVPVEIDNVIHQFPFLVISFASYSKICQTIAGISNDQSI